MAITKIKRMFIVDQVNKISTQKVSDDQKELEPIKKTVILCTRQFIP